jgi:flagellar basal body-associated protein FliL
VDSLKRNAEVTTADAGSVFIIILLILIVLGTIVSSIAVWRYQKEGKKR